MGKRDAVSWAVRQTTSRVVFGNDAGLKNNLTARRDLSRFRRDSPVTPRPAAEGAVHLLEARGWMTVPPVRQDLTRQLVAGYDRWINDPGHSHDMGGRIPGAARYVVDPVTLVPEMRELLTPALIEVLHAYYRAPFRLAHARMWRISSLPEDQHDVPHYGNVWHTDHHPPTIMKLFVQLAEGVTAENGALRLHDVATTRRIMRTGYVNRTRQVGIARSLTEDTSTMTFFDGPPGSGILVNPCRCLHRAGIPAPGTTRGMIQLTFNVAPYDPPGGDYFAAMPPDLSVIEARPVS